MTYWTVLVFEDVWLEYWREMRLGSGESFFRVAEVPFHRFSQTTFLCTPRIYAPNSEVSILEDTQNKTNKPEAVM